MDAGHKPDAAPTGPDAASDASDAMDASADASAEAGAEPKVFSPEITDDCGCRLTPHKPPRFAPTLLALGLALLWTRRRTRRTQASA
jgi:MYXO-CTERM domain-containing protein